MRPGRVLFGGLAVLYLLAYLRGTALLVAVTTVGLLVWRSRGARGRRSSGGAGRGPRWGVQDGWVATRPLAADVRNAGDWRMAPTVVHGVPEPAAGQPVGFAALVTLRDHAGRQAMLQIEAAPRPRSTWRGWSARRWVRQPGGSAGRWNAGSRSPTPPSHTLDPSRSGSGAGDQTCPAALAPGRSAGS